MRITRTKGMLLTLACAAFLVIPAHGEYWVCHWIDPCPPDPVTGCGFFLGAGFGPSVCYCDSDW